MSRDELYNEILEKMEIIKTTDSMRDLDIAHNILRNDVEKFALSHRMRINKEINEKMNS